MRCAVVHPVRVPCGCVQGPVAVFDPVVRKAMPVPRGLSVAVDNELLLILQEIYSMSAKFFFTFL